MATARKNSVQLVHYLRFAVNFNDAGVAAGVKKQTLPAGALVLRTNVMVKDVFNAATTNIMTVGLAGVADNLIAAADVSEGATGLTQNIKPTGTALGPLAADSTVTVTYTQSGTAATTGKAFVVIEYIPDNDL